MAYTQGSVDQTKTASWATNR